MPDFAELRRPLSSVPTSCIVSSMVERLDKTSGERDGTAAKAELSFREVTAETWPDFEKLFESRGGPKSCWCMVWRSSGAESPSTDGASRKAAMKQRIHTGGPVGILGYAGEVPVAWCSIAPRDTYRTTMAGMQPGDAKEQVWSVVCFFVARSARGQRGFNSLLEAAEALAKSHGATVLEGYPVDEDSPSYRFGGFVGSFEKTGFERIGRAGTRRYIVRKRLA
ncbi:GNAT family N-acetyltransferase [Hyphomonas sp.]|uniref:GNAT family N-acetyltransferase n=1 Tax=Hyphomonas sp. TaxID=87 RepID=UPI0025B9A082|nr:GNAT family N-acetyltransferase [Hyphomonas sp.]